MKLFDRRINLVVGELNISQLAISFHVKKSTKAQPNACTVTIRNLSDKSRAKLDKEKLPLKLEAGYKGGMSLLYLGEVHGAQTQVEGTETITEVSTADSAQAFALSKIRVAMGPKIPADIALSNIADALGVSRGNVDQVASKLRLSGAAMFGKGTVLSGRAADIMTDFCNSANLEWSIQDGKLQILDKDKALEGLAVELSSESGLMARPPWSVKEGRKLA